MPPSNHPRRPFPCQPLARRLRAFVRSLAITMPSKKPSLPQYQSSPTSTSSSASSFVEVESNPESELSLETASISSLSSTTSSSSSSTWTTDDEPLETNPVDEYMTNALTSQFHLLSISSPSPFTLPHPTFPPPSPSTAPPYNTYTPLTSPLLHQTSLSPHEIASKRTQFFLHLRAFYQGLLPDPFHEFRSIANNLFGPVLPPDIYLTSPPFPPTSTRGALRIRFIRAALSLPPSTPLPQIESFIARNPSVVSHLCFNIQPFSDIVFTPRCHPGHHIYVARPGALECGGLLLRALKEVAWGDEGADWVVGLARREDGRRLSALCKVKGKSILPSVRERMARVEERGERPLQDEQWHKLAVKQMRRERPNSLLRTVVEPHDVVEENI